MKSNFAGPKSGTPGPKSGTPGSKSGKRRDRKVGSREKKLTTKILLKSKLIQRISSKSFGRFHENKITYIPIIQINREKKDFYLEILFSSGALDSFDLFFIPRCARDKK